MANVANKKAEDDSQLSFIVVNKYNQPITQQSEYLLECYENSILFLKIFYLTRVKSR